MEEKITDDDYKKWLSKKAASLKKPGRKSKLSIRDKEDIKRYRAKEFSREYLALKYKVSVTTIRNAESI